MTRPLSSGLTGGLPGANVRNHVASVPPSQALVCGDRIAMDLVPAFELGFTTVHMRWGRGSLVKTAEWAHHAISDLSELKRIVKT